MASKKTAVVAKAPAQKTPKNNNTLQNEIASLRNDLNSSNEVHTAHIKSLEHAMANDISRLRASINVAEGDIYLLERRDNVTFAKVAVIAITAAVGVHIGYLIYLSF